MSRPDLLILGAGPAGVGAALSAVECGLDAIIVDAAPTGGGQVYRSLPVEFRRRPDVDLGEDRLTGDDQRRALAASGIATAFGRLVWSVGQDFRVDALGPNGSEHWHPRAIVVATGTTERIVPFPGWTLPGVIGLAAATVLLKSQLMLPGRRTLVAGCGPLLATVAYGIARHGGSMAAILDLSGRADWLAALPALLARPRGLGRGLRWLRAIQAASIPYHYRHGIREVRSRNDGLEVHVGPVDRYGRSLGQPIQRFDVDCVTVGHGLVPATEVTRLLGARHVFAATAGGWIPVLDAAQRTSREQLYAAGDGTGITGAAAAYLEGRVAGYTAALDLGRMDDDGFRHATAPWRRELARTVRFGRAMARLMTPRAGQIASIEGQTVVCRCEDVTRADIEEALDHGVLDVNQLKSWTRCGMGPCQGRMCGDTVAAIVGARLGDRERAGIWTPRVPLRPLDLEAFTGAFDYADIPIPKAAPL